MTQKRKAELQRKLSMAPVAKPPSDLADRIKADIPAYLDAEQERRRLSNSIAFSLRVAASIVLLVTSVFLAVQLLSRDERMRIDVMASKEPAPDAAPMTAPASSGRGVSVESGAADQAAEAPSAPQPTAVTPTVAPRLQTDVAEAESKEERGERRDEVLSAPVAAQRPSAEYGVAGGVTSSPRVVPAAPPAAPPPPPVAQVAEGAVANVGAVGMHDNAAVEPVAPPPPAPAETQARLSLTRQRAADTAKMTESVSVTSSAPALRAQSASAFGISTDPGAFTRVKNILERGEKPAAATIDVAALINHFAGAPERWPREVSMNVESSLAPLANDGTAMIRFTIDSAINVQVRLTVDLAGRGIREHRFISGARLAQRVDEKLVPLQSVTGIVELEPLARLRPSHPIATFTLQYISPNGKPVRITRVVQAQDLRKTWASASRRHRLATLGALWSESLRAARPSTDIATKATELAGEKPEDERAEDLAEAATASSRHQTPGPTGSGR